MRKVSGNGMLSYAVVVVCVLTFLTGCAGLDLIDGYYKVFRKKAVKLG